MISFATIGIIFFVSFVVTVQAGWAWTFIAVYFPALILLNQLPQIEVPHLPITVSTVPLYAMLLGMPFRGERFRFKFCSIDVVIALLIVSAAITAWSTEYLETGINTLRNDFLGLAAPYYLARVVFSRPEMRRSALWVMIGLILVISFFALVEFRAVPYFYQHTLQSLGMNNKLNAMAYNRYGFYRVSGPVEHPIYFGNMCVVLLGMTAVLASTSGVGLKNPWVITGLFACFGCVVTSISFTPYIGTIAGTAGLLMMVWLPFTRKLVLLLTLSFVVGLFSYTSYIAHKTLGDKPDGELPGSLWTRQLIITESWKKAEAAPLFGYGIRPVFNDDDDFDLKSIDNSYMQFTVTHGIVYTVLWTSIGVLFAFRVTRAFRKITHRSQVFPLCAATATVLALMVSMYTVWAGALYTVIWLIMLGLGNTLIDNVLEAAKAKTATPPSSRSPVYDYESGPSGPAIAFS